MYAGWLLSYLVNPGEDKISHESIELFEPLHDKYNDLGVLPSKDSNQLGALPSLIRVFAGRLMSS